MDLWPPEYEALRPSAREAIAAGAVLFESFRPKEVSSDPVVRVRAMREAMATLEVRVDQAVDRDIAGIPCREIRPEGDTRGVYLHFHGGGMVTGTPGMNDVPNARLAKRFGLAVVSVDYRLAPEHPHPAGPDDGLAVARWLVEHASDEYGSARLVIGGESAGAYLAAVTLLRVRDELDAIDRFEGANLVFGIYDWGRSPSQRGIRAMDGPDVLDPEGIQHFADCYLPGLNDDERRDPSVSPAFADLRGLPPAMVTVGGSDHLFDDSLMLAVRWRAAGNEVELAVYPDCPHGFQAIQMELSKHALDRVDAFFERTLA